MYLNKVKLREILDKKADGNYHELARKLNVDVAQLHRVLNTKSNPGPKFLGRLMKYCKKNDLNFNDYIILDNPYHTNVSKLTSVKV